MEVYLELPKSRWILGTKTHSILRAKIIEITEGKYTMLRAAANTKDHVF